MGKEAAGAKPLLQWGVVAAVTIALVVWAIGSSKRAGNREVVSEVPIAEAAAHEPQKEAPVEKLRVKVLKRFPHDTKAFTQGLIWHEGRIIESIGQYGHSALRFVGLTGEVQQQRELGLTVFAEGIDLVDDELFQLTWREHKVLVWEVHSLTPQREMPYEGEGWGLCFDGQSLVMSDGSSTLTFRDPKNFEVRRRVSVTNAGRRVRFLNELECVDDVIYANIWRRDDIVRIDPRTGRVNAVIDASNLLNDDEERNADVLNGIAYVPERQSFLLTGKHWPALFEVRFKPVDAKSH